MHHTDTHHHDTMLTPNIINQLEKLLSEVGPNDAVIVQKQAGQIIGFVRQANIRIREENSSPTLMLES